MFSAVQWYLQPRQKGQREVLMATAGGAAAAGGAEAGLTECEWQTLLYKVGVCGRLDGSYSENQWEWLRAAFLASPVPPHARATSTAERFDAAIASDLEVANSVGRWRKVAESRPKEAEKDKAEEWEEEVKEEEERDRTHGVMEVRAVVVGDLERHFWGWVAEEGWKRAVADAQAEYDDESEEDSASDDGSDDGDDDSDDLDPDSPRS